MKTVCEQNKCSGCMACLDICPHNSINIIDEITHYNAIIDETKCKECNLCLSVCPDNNQPVFRKPHTWYEGWATDEEIRLSASSGGAATALSKEFIMQGGVVCSCSFKNGDFVFSFAENVDELNKFAGSKYVKSNPVNAYSEIKKRIINGINVLFVGLPCQVAAVKNYVKNSDKLTTIDLICHGSPSPAFLNAFIKEKGYEIADFQDLQFRKKMKFQLFKKQFGDYKSVAAKGIKDEYLMAFLEGIIYTDNCYSCKYAQFSRVSDITLGDSWGSKIDEKEFRKGVSLILCSTEKGLRLVRDSKIELHNVDIENAIEYNQQLKEPIKEPENRKEFIRLFKQGHSFMKLVRKTYPKQYVKQMIKLSLIKLKLFHN